MTMITGSPAEGMTRTDDTPTVRASGGIRALLIVLHQTARRWRPDGAHVSLATSAAHSSLSDARRDELFGRYLDGRQQVVDGLDAFEAAYEKAVKVGGKLRVDTGHADRLQGETNQADALGRLLVGDDAAVPGWVAFEIGKLVGAEEKTLWQGLDARLDALQAQQLEVTA